MKKQNGFVIRMKSQKFEDNVFSAYPVWFREDGTVTVAKPYNDDGESIGAVKSVKMSEIMYICPTHFYIKK